MGGGMKRWKTRFDTAEYVLFRLAMLALMIIALWNLVIRHL
jgi:hypothetical protein